MDHHLFADNGIPEGSVAFDISAVNSLEDGMSRSGIYSQEATQHVTNVVVYAFAKSGSDYTYTKTYTITGWSDGTTFKRYIVADGDKLSANEYYFLAVGRDATDNFTLTTPAVGDSYTTMEASITANGMEKEIFAGNSTATVTDQGSRVSINMTRKVAGIMGYFKNVPQTLNGQTVQFLRLGISNANQQVNLNNGVGINTAPTTYNIINMDLSGQSVANGVYTGNDLSSQGVVKVPNSQLDGSFFMPVSNVSQDGPVHPLKLRRQHVEQLALRHRLHVLVGVSDGRVVVLDGGGHVAGQDLAGVMVQRRHRHGAGVQAAAELLVADHRQSVGQDGHLMTVLLDVLRRGVAHQGPPLDEPHPGDVGKEMALHVSPPKAHPAGMLRQCR